MNVPKGCTAQAFEDMTKTPGVLQRVCQIAFLPALICVVSVLVLFIPVIGGIAAAIGFWPPTWRACAVRVLASSGVAICRLRSMAAWIVR